MIRFEILGHQIQLYEVPYISPPTLNDEDMVKDQEYSEIKNKDDGDIQTINKQIVINDKNYKGIESEWQQAVKESIQWFKQAKKDDPRVDKFASVILSRMYPKIKDY